MTALIDATETQMAILADLVAGVRSADQTISSAQAARDGMLALAARLAIEIAQQAGHPDHGDMALRAIAAEIGAAQRVSDRVIERRMIAASSLVETFPEVWASQGAARITAAHTRVITDAGAHLSAPADRAGYAQAVLVLAEQESPNRLRLSARRLAETFQPRSATERHRDARDHRGVWVRDLDDGMSELGAYGPSTLIHGIHDRLSQMAHAVHAEQRAHTQTHAWDSDASCQPVCAHEPRSIGQLRFDLLADLALSGVPTGHETPDALLGAIRARVEITVPVTTLMTSGAPGADRRRAPAELDGMCPVDLDTAALLAAEAPGWDRVLTHPISGAVLAVDRYRPGEPLRRHLRARDQRCRFPACGLGSRRCDIDHTHAAASGGETCDENLAHLCRRHHMLKHHSSWRVRASRDGDLEWRSPTGRVYIDRPPSTNTVTFAPSDPDHGDHTDHADDTDHADHATAPF